MPKAVSYKPAGGLIDGKPVDADAHKNMVKNQMATQNSPRPIRRSSSGKNVGFGTQTTYSIPNRDELKEMERQG